MSSTAAVRFGFRAGFRIDRRWRRPLPLPLHRQLFHRHLRQMSAERALKGLERDSIA